MLMHNFQKAKEKNTLNGFSYDYAFANQIRLIALQLR